MSEKVAEDDQLAKQERDKLGANFNTGYVAHEITGVLKESAHHLRKNIKMITKLVTYISSASCTDRQRREAEIELFGLLMERDQLEQDIRNALVIAPDLMRPVTINT